jgi:hypothetical protein
MEIMLGDALFGLKANNASLAIQGAREAGSRSMLRRAKQAVLRVQTRCCHGLGFRYVNRRHSLLWSASVRIVESQQAFTFSLSSMVNRLSCETAQLRTRGLFLQFTHRLRPSILYLFNANST